MAGLGIFDYLSNLNQQAMGGPMSAVPPGAPTALRSVSDFLTNNPALVSNLAYSIGNAPSLRQGVINVGRGMPDAMSADKQTQEASQSKAALGQYLGSPDTAKALTPGQLQFLKALPPDVAAKYAGQALFPPVSASNSTDITEYKFYSDQEKAAGRTPVSFMDWQTKIKGATGAQKSAFNQPILDYGPDNNVRGIYQGTNRGTFLHYAYDANGGMHFVGEVGQDGVADQPNVQSGPPAGAPGPLAQPAAPGAPQAPPPSSAGGGIRPNTAVRSVDAANGTVQTTGGGAPVGFIPKNNTQAEADKTAGADQAKDLHDVQNASIKATSQKNTMTIMRRAAADPNFYSGALADQVEAARKLFVALGGDPSLAASMENFGSLSNQLVKDRLGSLGTGVSNADVGFISRTVPTLDATPQGNQQLLDILDKLADRDIEVAKLAQDYAAKSGGGTRLDANWPTYLAQWAASHPIFAGASGGGGAGPSVDDLIKKYAP